MNFEIIPTELFLEQLNKIDNKSKRSIESKIELIKINPYRYKRIHSKKFSKAFRIRLNICKEETRMIYVVIDPRIILVGLLQRKNNYKDLDNYLRKIS